MLTLIHPGMARPNVDFRSLPRALALVALLAGLLHPLAGAQELPWLGKGRVRLDFAPEFWSWDSRYGMTADGSEEVEELGLDLTANPLGSDIIPNLRDLESLLGEAIGDGSYRVRLGVSQAIVDQSVLTFPFRLEVGVTDWLTVGAMVPLVRPRTEILFALDADSASANVGASPQATSPAAVSTFLGDFRNYLTQANESFPGDPSLAEAQAFYDAISAAYYHQTVFPILGSSAGTLLQERLGEIGEALAGLGIGGFPETVPLANSYMDDESFRTFLGGNVMRAAPLEDWTNLWSLGDIEVTAAFRVLQGGFEPDSLGELPHFRYQVGGGLVLRLATGANEDPHRFLDVDASDDQTDLEGSVFALVEVGSRFAAWGQFRYGIQREGSVVRRIAAPQEVLPNYQRTAALSWTPGNYTELDLNPRFYLAEGMSFGLRYHRWSKGAASYKLQPIDPELLAQLAYPPAEILNGETEQTLQEVGFSATYTSLAAHARGQASIPFYVRATYFRPMTGSGGQTPKGGRFEVGLTLYRRLWGRGSQEESAPNLEGR
ncbi:hypothetical protein ACFL3Z_01430 [Gemmatimonadota bacterium]